MKTTYLRDLLRIFERAIPVTYALEGDPIGLHVGDPDAPITKIVTALEVTGDVIDQAKTEGAELLLVHHPLIYQPLNRLAERTVPERLAARLVREGIALYAAHTNVDLHPQGMGLDWAQRLGLINAKSAVPKPQVGCVKLVTFVPESHLLTLRAALADAGAGQIGEYDTCSFSHPGTGSFRGSDLADPFVGKKGELKFEPEHRIEMAVPKGSVSRVVSVLFQAHPYEEPAYDLVELAPFRGLHHAIWTGRFEPALSGPEFMERVAASIPGFTGARANAFPDGSSIERVALSTGSGSTCLPAVMGMDVDVYLTGELGYHLFWEAQEVGPPCVAVGHWESEQFFSSAVARILEPYKLPVPLVAARKRCPDSVFRM